MQGQDIGPSIGLESSPGLLHTRAGSHWWDGSCLHPHLPAPSPWAQRPRSGHHWAEQLGRPGLRGLCMEACGAGPVSQAKGGPSGPQYGHEKRPVGLPKPGEGRARDPNAVTRPTIQGFLSPCPPPAPILCC